MHIYDIKIQFKENILHPPKEILFNCPEDIL